MPTRQVNRITKATSLVVIAIVALLPCCAVPSDSVMEAHFLNNKTAFDELIAMYQVDANIQIIHCEPNPILPDDSPNLPMERLATYRELMAITGCDALIRRDSGAIACIYARSKWGECKHFIYSEKPLEPLYNNLDDLHLSENEATYKDLGNGWYIEFYFSS